MNIRKACFTDAAAIAEIEEQSFVHPWSLRSIEQLLEDPNTLVLVAESEEKTVAYAGVNTVVDEGYITNIAVLPAFRGQRIAYALLGKLIEEAKALQLSFVTLEVRPSNKPAVRLYEYFGFIKAGERKNYYTQPTENALLLTKYF